MGDINITGKYRVNGVPIHFGGEGQPQTPWESNINGNWYSLYNVSMINGQYVSFPPPATIINEGDVLTINSSGQMVWATPSVGNQFWQDGGNNSIYYLGRVGVGVIPHPAVAFQFRAAANQNLAFSPGQFTDGVAIQAYNDAVNLYKSIEYRASLHYFGEGSVGINISAPQYRLDVNGDVNSTGCYRINRTAFACSDGASGINLSNITTINGETPGGRETDPAPPNQSVQFNSSGEFGGSSNFTFNPSIPAVSIGGSSYSNRSLNVRGVAGIPLGGPPTLGGIVWIQDTQAQAGMMLGTAFPASGNNEFAWIQAYEQSENSAGALVLQPAGVSANNNVGIGRYPYYRLDVAGDVNISLGNFYRINGVPLSFPPSPGGATNGQVLTVDSSAPGGMSWITSTGIPAGSNRQIQYNNNGVFGASPRFGFYLSSFNSPSLLIDGSADGGFTPPLGSVQSAEIYLRANGPWVIYRNTWSDAANRNLGGLSWMNESVTTGSNNIVANIQAMTAMTGVAGSRGSALQFYTRKSGPAAGTSALGMAIDENQFVGIGTSTPATQLDVIGTVRTTGDIEVGNNLNINSYWDGSASRYRANKTAFAVVCGIGATVIYGAPTGVAGSVVTLDPKIKFNDNETVSFPRWVGILNDNPQFALDIGSGMRASGNRSMFVGNGENYTIGLANSPGSGTAFWLGVSPDYYFVLSNASGNNLITVDGNGLTAFTGNVGVGAAPRADKLFVYSNDFSPGVSFNSAIRAEGAYGGGILITDVGVVSGMWGYMTNLEIGYPAAAIGQIEIKAAGGGVVVGTMLGVGSGAPSEYGDIACARVGNAYQGVVFLGIGGQSYLFYDGASYMLPFFDLYVNNVHVPSDVRMKENIRPVSEDSLAILNSLNFVEFETNGTKGSVKGKKGIGLVAQEVKEILPDAVGVMHLQDAPDDDILAVNYQPIQIHAIRAILELAERIKKLESRN